MRRPRLYAAALLLLAAATARAGEPTFTQSFKLEPGWNAIYLNVQPADSAPEAVFQGLSVISVWTRAFETGGPEFIQNPEEVLRPELRPPGWLVYVPAEQPDAFLTTLESIQGNRAFLVHLGADPAEPELQVTGTPLVPFINWQPAAFNLVGFPVDPDDPPTFEDYFASSDAHRGQPVFELLASGVWQQISVPDVERIQFGEAYQVYAGGGSSFVAPLALDVPTTDGLAYGRGVTEHTLRLSNPGTEPLRVEIEALDEPDTVPLSYFRVRTEPPAVGTFEWPPLPSPLVIDVGPGTTRSVRLSVRRDEFVDDHLGTVVSVRSGGTKWMLPLTADKMDTTSAGLAGQGRYSGLWVGNAIVNRVSQPNLSPPGMEPVAPVPGENVCQGGPNVGLACPGGDADCPVLCSADPPKRCAGGVNAGLACTADDPDCPGSTCGDLMDRCKGGPREGGLCSAADGNDCPNGACGEVLRCADDTDVECTAENAADVCPGSTCQPIRLCTGGDNVGARCDAQDCPSGTCVPPDDKCLGGDGAGNPCATDEDCPDSRCNAVSRCIGGPQNARACATDSDCGSSICAPPSGRASEFPLRLILHVDGDGKVRFLKQVIQMWQEGTTKRDAEDGARVLDTPGHFVLLTDDELIPSFHGATLRDGVPVGRRLSTAAFDFPGNELEMSGSFRCGTGELSATIALDRNFPTNPYRHPFHPDHDNLSGGGASKICRGGTQGGAGCQTSADCPGGGSCQEVEEAFSITRSINLDFASRANDATRPPQSCVDQIEGVYRETISGLHRNDIHVAGTFRLQRVALTPELNPQPQ